eukprot:TRINITY_DN6321_c0_g1_i1.p1 TRINITY_DN6321_c0_g1~~TRINITY_DN6321_c0_g1_i1.p1  ORF type:complete len:236 (+),score=37.25 TRINITY_DN6321_c0_g1_i1:99-710(+)
MTTELPSLDSLTPESVGAASDLGSVAAAIKGTMDGERPPMTKVEEIKHALEPYQKKYGHYLGKLRSWRDFLRISKPEGDIKARLESNLTHYQINYAVIFLILMIVSIVMNPQCLAVIGVLAVVWIAFLRKNDDPNWQVSFGGMQFGKTQRWMALTAITAIVFLSVVGQVIFSAAFFCAVFVLVHGVLHPAQIPVQTDEAEEMI